MVVVVVVVTVGRRAHTAAFQVIVTVIRTIRRVHVTQDAREVAAFDGLHVIVRPEAALVLAAFP